MSRLIQLQTHPFRLLLYLEWILLGIAIVPRPPFPLDRFPHPNFEPLSLLLTILSIATFGVMGLRLPKGKLLSKVLYTGVGFGLILLAIFAGSQDVRFFPSLLLILVIRSCLIFGLVGRLIVTGLVFISALLILFLQFQNFHDLPRPPKEPMFQAPISEHVPRGFPVPPPKIPLHPDEVATGKDQKLLNLLLNVAVLFGLVLVFVLLLINALLAERQSKQKLAIANEQLRQYARRIEDQATLQERNRIAREIHDSLGHSLTAQSIQLENALLFLPSNTDKAQTFLQEAKRLGKDALQEVRQSIATLRSNPLQEQSLEDAIASLVEDFRRTTGIVPECQINLSFIVPDSTLKLSLPLPSEINTAIYRITKEALNNIYKHSEATQVTINLQANAEALCLLVKDNGRGFHPEENTTGFGLKGMQERAVALGGKFNIVSEPETGCRITVYIPLPTLYPYS
ncbi:MAG TPA: two-component sensor histidine kinase [Cyanobacteria bacterium UBA8553]|nr:two-component sensor histidine kinase [Cyanobacteria bacterium UBA8553]HAJ63988.1 two-component sensor histidine kinase [Cyanobacteria bacterium UBA8543]